MLRKALALSAFLLALLPLSAHAHGWMITASTPLTPPLTLIWITPLFVAAMIWWDWKLLQGHAKRRHIITTNLAVVFFILLIIFVVGVFIDPFGNPGFPAMPLLGSSLTVGGIGSFVFANMAQLILLLFFKHYRIKRLKAPPELHDEMLWQTARIYGICLIPFVLFASMIHGMGGFYVDMNCSMKRVRIADGVIKYAQAHSGRLPEAEDIGELLEKVTPYFEKGRIYYPERLDTCPFEISRQIYRKRYEWNKGLNGIPLAELIKRYDEPIISCNTKDWLHEPSAITLMDLVRHEMFEDPGLKAILEKERPG